MCVELRQRLIDYLTQEKELLENDITSHEQMSDDDLVEIGLMIDNCSLVMSAEDSTVLSFKENTSKIRQGDKVFLIDKVDGAKQPAEIIEISPENVRIDIFLKKNHDTDFRYQIRADERVYTQTIINLLETIHESQAGSKFLEYLDENRNPVLTESCSIETISIPSRFNENQRSAIELCLGFPNVACVHGPPGTGKTDVLAFVAKAYSDAGFEVLIISHTHQAVNNALEKISGFYSNPTIKIGSIPHDKTSKSGVLHFSKYTEYLSYRKSKSHRRQIKGDIVGMSILSAAANLGFRISGFSPIVALVDEASQLPLSIGSIIGKFGVQSVIFFGDDRQLPPIFHQDLIDHDLSESIFTRISRMHPDSKVVLNHTYRMNSDITTYVSKHFYEPYSIMLKSDRNPIYSTSIDFVDYIYDSSDCNDFNDWEAENAATISMKYSAKNKSVAIITPFRKQVNLIRHYIKENYHDSNLPIPIVDTVERLQGMDVDIIIISFSVTNPDFYKATQSFITNPNRLNVMFSRAKDKVIILKSNLIKLM
ncbi:MAG: AAA family ATPase [Bacteroides sp.]|nr:AAA family ATPase [Bacteroides sp.]